MSEIIKEGFIAAQHGTEILSRGEQCIQELNHGFGNNGQVHNLLSEALFRSTEQTR